MIEWVMIGALGFFLGCLLALMIAPPLWNRAVKLTTKKLEATMPMSLADIQAARDQLRAEYAIEIRKVEVALDKAKERATRELIEANKRRVEIQVLDGEIAAAKAEIQEKDNANRVLQQTIKRRLPDLDNRLKTAKKALAELETVNTELRGTVASQSEALKSARATLHNQRADIDRLRASLEAGGAAPVRSSWRGDSRYLGESQRLSAELSRAQEELKRAQTNAEENTLLRHEMARLAEQILAVTRGQEAHPRAVAEVTQAFAAFAERPEPQPEAAAPVHGGNGGMRDEVAVEAEIEAETVRVEVYDEPPAEADTGVEEETATAADTPPVLAEEPREEEVREEEPREEEPREEEAREAEAAESDPSEESKTPLSKRIGRRRARRRAGKAGGKTLGERLKGLVVADAPETHS